MPLLRQLFHLYSQTITRCRLHTSTRHHLPRPRRPAAAPAVVDTSNESDVQFQLELESLEADNEQAATTDDSSPFPPEGALLQSPDELTVLLFPGQGSQFVGMARALLDFDNVRAIFEYASERLGYDLLDVCLNGPEERLRRTQVCQAAVFVTSIAALERLKAEQPDAIERCYATAGFSVGEYAALTFADALSFDDALQLVQLRAAAMQSASERCRSGLLTVKLTARSALVDAIRHAIQYCEEEKGIEEPVLKVAIDLATQLRVVGGHDEALKFLEVNASDYFIKPLRRVPVSGAFHTPLMKPARRVLQQALDDMSKRIRRPSIPVLSNCTGTEFSSAAQVRSHLVRSLTSPLRWEQSVKCIYNRPKQFAQPRTFEVGPGRQLGVTLRDSNRLAYARYQSIAV